MPFTNQSIKAPRPKPHICVREGWWRVSAWKRGLEYALFAKAHQHANYLNHIYSAHNVTLKSGKYLGGRALVRGKQAAAREFKDKKLAQKTSIYSYGTVERAEWGPNG